MQKIGYGISIRETQRQILNLPCTSFIKFTQLIDLQNFCFPLQNRHHSPFPKLNHRWAKELHIDDVQWIAGNVVMPPKPLQIPLLWASLLYATVPMASTCSLSSGDHLWLLNLLWSKHERTRDSSPHGWVSTQRLSPGHARAQWICLWDELWS